MMWLALLYLFMLIFRPFEYWPVLSDLHMERFTLLAFILAVLLSKRSRWRASPLNAAVLTLFGANAFATLLSTNPSGSYDLLYELFKFSILYFLFSMIQTTWRYSLNLILGYVGVMALYVGKSAWEFFVNGRHFYRMGISRMVGIDSTLGDPNSFAASMAYSLPWAVFLLRLPGLDKRFKWGALGYIGMALTSIVFTGSRSGQLTCLLLGAMLLASSSRKALYLSCSLIVLLVGWNAMPEDYQTRFISAFDHDVGPANAAESAESRGELFREALTIFGGHPLAGVGPGMFAKYSEYGLSPHNLYGQILSETGLLGTLAFTVFLVTLWRELVRLRAFAKGASPREGESQPCALLASAIGQTIILLLFNGMASHNFYRYNWMIVAALAASRCFSQSTASSRTDNEPKEKKPCPA